MGKIDELIKQLCQCGVKRAKLVDYAKVQYGFAFNSKLFTEDSANIPLIRIRDVIPGKPSTYYLGEYSDEYIVKKGDILVGMDGNFNLEKWNDRNGLLNQRVCKIFTKNAGMLLDGFLYHYLKPVFKKIENSIQGSTVKHLSAKVINGIEIPLPPLAVQKKIVEILDTFTGMIGNLQKELEQRQKQFEHYCDNFYGDTFEGMKNLGKQPGNKVVRFSELGTITRGKRFVRDDVREVGQPCIHYGDMYTYYGTHASITKTYLDRDFPKKMRYAEKGDVVIVGAGENDYDIGVGLVWEGEEPAAVHDACYILQHQQIPMYISYYLRSNIYHKQLKMYVSSGKISSFSAEGLGKVFIPIQSLEKQQEIVDKLDTFEALISNIKQEIELRQKQYEFYREKLLTFE